MGHEFYKRDWKIDVTGVEVFPKYITPIQRRLYNRIIQKDIFDALGELEEYDVIILGDVIEHIEKERVYELLEELFKHSQNILISTPLGFLYQEGTWSGNRYEVHKSRWKLKDFRNYQIVEYRILRDELTDSIVSVMKNVPKEFKNFKIRLLVLWLRK